MKHITEQMIRMYKLKELGIDFMGYEFHKNDASFHHLIVPKRKGGPETIQNGAILMQSTSHNYLHLTEQVDFEIFSFITSEMIDMNIKGYIDPQNLHYIDDALNYFEHQYSGLTTKKGKPLIKEQYTKRLKKY
jgi:hypothetical protein